MTGRKVVYVLNTLGNLGCLPEPYLIDVDDKDNPGTGFVSLANDKIRYYENYLTENDKKIIVYCRKLEKKSIISFVSDFSAQNWDTFYSKYFNPQDKLVKTLVIREQIYNYINRNLHGFFSELKEGQLFLIEGKFPFSWKEIKVQTELADMFYKFGYDGKSITYSPKIEFHESNLDITGAILVSRKPARIMRDDRIYEFPDDIEGNKLIAFFKKPCVYIPSAKTEEYISSIIMPLVLTNRVIPEGFKINVLTEITDVVLNIKETAIVGQLSLFGETEEKAATAIIDLNFHYDDFCFSAGRIGRLLKLEKSGKDFLIRQVVRDDEAEKYYIQQIKGIGLDLNGRTQSKSLSDCVEYLILHKIELDELGITVNYKNKQQEKEILFTGIREIRIELCEQKDWFDVKAVVHFGDVVIPFLKILDLMRRGKSQFVLPDGQIAQIPSAWFEEYISLLDVCKVKDNEVRLSHFHVSAIVEIESKIRMQTAIKDKYRRLISQDIINDYDLPKSFNAELRIYQKQGYSWLRLLDELGLGACLSDDMGLGKTIQTLALLQWLKEENRTQNLLVVPTSLVFNWLSEISKFCSELNVYVHTGPDRLSSDNFGDDSDVIITSYAILRRDKSLFAGRSFGYLILDESQTIKNAGSDIFQTVISLKAQRFLTLTGTPLENSYSDIWSQMHFINRGILGSLKEFNSKMQNPDYIERAAKLIKPFMLRRTKSQVLSDLPDKLLFTEYCEMGEEQYTFYRDLRNTYRERFISNRNEKGKLNAIVVLEGLLRLRQAANHPVLVDREYSGFSGKFDSVITRLNDVIAQNAKVLIFSSFVEHLKIYKEYFDNNKIKYCYLDGGTTDREAEVARFQDDEKYKVFLLSLKAGGTGLNLTAASYVFLLDPWWNPAAETQATDRAHRIGQKKAVFVYRFISVDSIEEKILNLQKDKLKMLDKMLGESPEDFKITNADEVLSLLD